MSPSAEIQDGNKRPAIICSFFAKGWCIRGTSCRFLHIKDRESNAGQLAEGDQVNSNWKREVQLEEGKSITSLKPRCPRIYTTLSNKDVLL